MPESDARSVAYTLFTADDLHLPRHTKAPGADASMDIDASESNNTARAARVLSCELRHDAHWRRDNADLAVIRFSGAAAFTDVDVCDGRQLPHIGSFTAVHPKGA